MFYTQGKSFIDDQGRQRIFHGVNFVDKGECDINWTDRGVLTDMSVRRKYGLPTDDTFFFKLASKGYNIIRLGVTWDALEPKPGVYNEEYLKNISDFFDVAGKYGLFVFIDLHQDVYSGYGNGWGDGAPAWACLNKKGRRYHTPKFGIWAEPYFFGKVTAECFDAFWNNEPVDGVGLQDRYAMLVKKLAETVKDKPNFFGFDFMNEPFPGSIGTKVFRKILLGVIREGLFDMKFHTLKLIISFIKGENKKAFDCITPEALSKATKGANRLMKKFDREYHTPFMNKMTAALREVTENGIVITSSSYWNNIGIPFFGGPVTDADGNPVHNQCLGPHAYDFMVDTDDYNFASDARVDYMLSRHGEAQERLGQPVILGEWGCTCFNGSDWLKHIEHITEEVDGRLWSHCYFTSKEIVYSIPYMFDIIDRPYPRATAGKVHYFKYDKVNRTFEMEYECDSDAGTVITFKRLPQSIQADGRVEVEEKHTRCNLRIIAEPGVRKIFVKL